jgi:hypothetical protein
MKRHPKSTRLARFRPNLPPTLTSTPSNPLAMSVYEARCEISLTSIVTPIRLQVSEGSSCLGLIGMGGYKNRSPTLNYFLLDKEGEGTYFPEEHFFEVGLAGIARGIAVDESRRLIFVGDDDRVKSYAWGAPDGTYYKKPLPTHTLDSDRFSGPIVTLPNGTIVRAGKGSAGVWEFSGLDTHGDNGGKTIGQEMDIDDLDSWRDDPDDIELSTGSAPISRIEFIDQPSLKPSIWKSLIAAPSTVLCAEFARESNNYDCIALDLETGKTKLHYLGHGATVADFSVSAGDPQVFLTASHDGYVRLFDVRLPLPALTFDACGQVEFCDTAALAHPNGIPSKYLH